MAKKYIKFLAVTAVLMSSSMASNTSYADIISAITSSSSISTGKVTGSIDNLIAGYGSEWQSLYLFMETPFKQKVIALGNTYNSGQLYPADKTIYLLKPQEDNRTNHNPLSFFNMGGSPFDQRSGELFIKAPAIEGADNESIERDFRKLQPIEQAIFFSLNANSKSVSNNNDSLLIDKTCPTGLCNPTISTVPNYNIDTLLGPTAYNDAAQREAAKKFIQYATLLAVPLPSFSNAELKAAGDEGKNYLIFLRSYIAAQSAGLSNLYQMLIARTPVTDLGKQAGMAKQTVSPLEVEQYAATRRLNPNIKTSVKQADGKKVVTVEKNWQESMEAASPAQVQREMVYLLAEMRQELYQQRLATERLMAIMSLMQIEQNRQALSLESLSLKSKIEQANYKK